MIDTEHADVGYMEWRDFQKLKWAVSEAGKLVPWLRTAGFVNFGDNVSVQTSMNGHANLAPTWLAAEEITRLLNELNQFPELEDAANDKYGQYVAVMLTREVQTAAYKWPYEDKPHEMWIRCGGCEQLTLRYIPPRFEGDLVKIKCRACFYELGEQEFLDWVELVTEEERLKKVGNDRRRSA